MYSQHMQDNLNQQMIQTERFPYAEATDYTNLQTIVQAFPHLKNINKPLIQCCPNAKNNILTGVVIRSANDDNVHKAIKYGIWTTTVKNRTKLNQLFIKSKSEHKQVYLFFSVVKSGMFQAVAKLKSGLIQDIFPYWWDDFSHKFKDYFQIQWIYIKDVNFNHFQKMYNYQNQQVSLSKDCDLIDSNTTYKMLEKFSKKPIKNKWIFNDFQFMDQRQKEYTRQSQSPYMSQANYASYDYSNSYNMGMTNYANMGYNPMSMMYTMNNEQSIPLPPQMLRPTTSSDNYNRNDFGFQKNPVSRNRKK